MVPGIHFADQQNSIGKFFPMAQILGLISVLMITYLWPISALAQNADLGDFSLDRFSTIEVPVPFSTADLIDRPGGQVHIPYSNLGLPVWAEVDAFSYGVDRLVPLGPNFFVSLEYSVWRESWGAGGIVSTEFAGNGNAGDKFRLYILRSGRVVGPWLAEDAEDHNLTPRPPGTESNIDGISWPPGTRLPVYFSVDRSTASALGMDAAAIYVVEDPFTSPVWKVYATSAQLGLLRGFLNAGRGLIGDNIDGLAIADGGEKTVYEPTDVIYISLDFGGTFTTYFPQPSGDGVIQVSPPANPPVLFTATGVGLPGAVVLGPGMLDLNSFPHPDQLDGMTAFDPGPCWGKEYPPPEDPKETFKLRPWCEVPGEEPARYRR